MTLIACCVQANCTAIAPIVVQVVDLCPTCSPNEVRLPTDIYSSRLIPAAQQPVFIQYRLVSVVTFGEGFVLLVLHPGGLANTSAHTCCGLVDSELPWSLLHSYRISRTASLAKSLYEGGCGPLK